VMASIRDSQSGIRTLRRAIYLLVAVLLLLALYAQMMGSVRYKSATYDEQTYFARGYAVLRTGDMRLRLRHPLLTNLISAAPLLLLPDLSVPTDHGSWTSAEFHEFSAQFLWDYNREWADQIIYLARWPMMLLTVVLAAFVYRWARALYGTEGALLALGLIAFDPNFIAHGRLANTDIGATAGIFIAAYAFWAYQRRPGRFRLLLAGIACGLAQTTRFTALLLFPIFGLEMLVAEWVRGDGSRWHGLARVAMILLALAGISLVTIWAICGFAWGPVDGTGLSLPAPDHWGEFLSLVHRLARADRAFLMGRIYEGGWWPYFFVAFAVKTPLPTLVLIVWATVRGVRHRCLLRDLPFVLPVAAYFAFAVAGNLNTGYRFILPVLPFLAVHAARLAPSATRFLVPAPRISRYLLGVLAVVLVFGTLSVYPHYLAFFNGLVSPRNGYKVLVDSNLDWGQDLPGLQGWMEAQGVEQVYLSWFGIAPPEHYGVRRQYLPGWPPFENPSLRVYHPERPLPGMYAISATNLQGVLLEDPDTFAFFRALQPMAQIGYSILVYEVPASAPPANLALGGVRLDQISAPLLDNHLVTNDLRLRWFDPATSLVLMSRRTGGCYYAIATDRPPAESLAARFLSDLQPVAGEPGFRIYPCPDNARINVHLDMVAASPVFQSPEVEFAPDDAPDVRAPVSLPASFDGQVGFLGYELLTQSPAPGKEMALLTYWRILERPEHPLKIFVHMLDDHSRIWGQHDGLDVPLAGWVPAGWVPGDVIVQLHTFSVAADAPPGRYWIEAGLYDPQTSERLPITGGDGPVSGNRLLLSEVFVQ